MIRRDLLTILPPAALALSGVATAAPATINPDACLIALCAQFEALEHKAIASLAKDDSEQERADAIAAVIDEEQDTIAAAIVACNPVSLEGFVALASIVVLTDPELMDCSFDECLYSNRMLRTLLCGLTGRAGA